MMKKIKCSKCGKKIPAESKFCKYCGSKAIKSQEKAEKKRIDNILVPAIGLIVLGVVIFNIAAMGSRPSEKKTVDRHKHENFTYGSCKVVHPSVENGNTRINVEQLNLQADTGLVTDIAVSSDGKTIYAADADKHKIFVFNKGQGNNYILKRTIDPVTGKGGPSRQKLMYIDLDEKEGRLYLVDCEHRAISSYGVNGGKGKLIAQSDDIPGIRSMRFVEGGLLACSFTPGNKIIFFDKNGIETHRSFADESDECEKLKQPSFAAMSDKGDLVILDNENRRILIYRKGRKTSERIAIGREITIIGPRIIFFTGAKTPYLVSTVEQSLMFITMDGRHAQKYNRNTGPDYSILKGISILEKDRDGNIYAVSARENRFMKITTGSEMF